jgi:acyl transferase domain-containing protein
MMGPRSTGRARLFLLQSFDEASNKRQAEKLSDYLEARASEVDDHYLNELAYTLDERRTNFPWKAAVPSQSVTDLIKALRTDVKPTRAGKKPTLGFVFTGQGAQWCGMGKELLDAYPVFRETIDKIGAYLTSIGAPFDVKGITEVFSV